jgi:hypothetical protein
VRESYGKVSGVHISYQRRFALAKQAEHILTDWVIEAITKDTSPGILLSFIACVAGALHDIAALDGKEDTSSELVVLAVFYRGGHDRLRQASDQRSFLRSGGRRGDHPQAVQHR